MANANTLTHDRKEWDAYLALLLRSPRKADMKTLESAAATLGLSFDDVRRDSRLIARGGYETWRRRQSFRFASSIARLEVNRGH